MVNFFLPCPELTSGNEHSLFELTNVKLLSVELLFCKNTFKMYKYFCLKTHSCLCRVRDANKVVTKKMISVDPESKVPIKILFPYRYDNKF